MSIFSNDIKPFLSFTFVCELCAYGTNKKSNINNHFLSIKHKSKTISNVNSAKGFTCLLCSKTYKDNSGLWRHKKACKAQENLELLNSNTLIINLINQNKELQQMLLDQNNKIFELFKDVKNGNNTTNNNTNNTNNVNSNNTFNLQVYLTDTCKDAINLSEFVESLEVKLNDLEETARLGYTDGVSRIFINGLNEMEVCKRPIQCSDLKRETLYIKNDNEWTKDDNKVQISKAVKVVSRKNVSQIGEWQKKYPKYKDSESKQNDKYMEMISNVMAGGSKEEQEHNVSKIVRNVTKETVIDKNLIPPTLSG